LQIKARAFLKQIFGKSEQRVKIEMKVCFQAQQRFVRARKKSRFVQKRKKCEDIKDMN